MRQPADGSEVGRPVLSQLAYKHQKVQRLRRLVGRRSARQAEGKFVVEGAKVFAEALAAGVDIESVYLDPNLIGADDALHALVEQAYAAGSRVYELEEGVLARVAGTVSPQGVLAIVPQIDVPLSRLHQLGADLVVVCVDVRDPGNAGTVLRSAEAAGAGGVVCCDGSVDIYNPKTVRASAGTLFHLPVVVGGGPADVLKQLGGWGLARLGAVATGGEQYTEADLARPIALVVGNEAHGLDDDARSGLDGLVTIPMAGRGESINVGMAAAVLCFEAARQRRRHHVGQSTG
jgi:RNA methyltransferase, TrmH family